MSNQLETIQRQVAANSKPLTLYGATYQVAPVPAIGKQHLMRLLKRRKDAFSAVDDQFKGIDDQFKDVPEDNPERMEAFKNRNLAYYDALFSIEPHDSLDLIEILYYSILRLDSSITKEALTLALDDTNKDIAYEVVREVNLLTGESPNDPAPAQTVPALEQVTTIPIGTMPNSGEAA